MKPKKVAVSLAPTPTLPALKRITLPMPFPLDHVYVYLAEERDGWCMIDTGLGGAYGEAIWEAEIAQLLDGRPVKRLICTHFHPDHLGAASWICNRYGCPLYMPEHEYLFGIAFANGSMLSSLSEQSPFSLRAGLTGDTLNRVRTHFSELEALFSSPPKGIIPIREGDSLTIAGVEWQAMLMGGHSPAHLVLHDPVGHRAVLTDIAIKGVTPNVGVMPLLPQDDPLKTWFETLNRLEALGTVEVLSGHKADFTLTSDYCNFVRDDHADKFERLREAAETPRTMLELAQAMFQREFTSNDMFFAVGEGLAHINHLVIRGELQEHVDAVGYRSFSKSAR